MKGTVPLTLFAAAIAAAASGVIRHDLRRRTDLLPSKTTDTGTLDRPLDLDSYAGWMGMYLITIEVGSPPQRVDVELDTGSSDLWLPSASAENCGAGHCLGGAFEASESSTFSSGRNGMREFKMKYLSGSVAKGNFTTDVVRLGSVALEDYTFGLASLVDVYPSVQDAMGARKTAPQYGIMGIGYADKPTIPWTLKDRGNIGSQSYSLFFDDIRTNNGHVVFGGIDTSKYEENLETLTLDGKGQAIRGTGFSMTYRGVTKQITPKNFKTTVQLDTGDSALELPPSVFDHILETLSDIAFVNHTGTLLVPCWAMDEDASITIQLTGHDKQGAVDIEIPLSNMLIPALTQEDGDSDDVVPVIVNGNEQCIFSAVRSEYDMKAMEEMGGYLEIGIGQPFFRSAYAFYNFDTHTVSLAQAKYNVTEESNNIVPVGPSDDASTYPRGTAHHGRRAMEWQG